MTQIRLDAATLAKFQAATGPIMLCNEAGVPVSMVEQPPVEVIGAEGPTRTEEELRAIEANPVRYKLVEVWDRIHRGEKL